MQRLAIAEFDARVIYQHQLTPGGDCTEESLANPPPGLSLLRHFFGDDLFTTINRLEIYRPRDPERQSVEVVGHLTKLSNLKITGCPGLSQLEGLEKLRQLETLYIANCENVIDYSPLSKLRRLKDVSLYGCNNMAELPFHNCVDIERISIGGAKQAGDLSILASMVKLSELSFAEIETIDLSTAGPNNITSLSISFCRSRIDITGISNFRSLKILSLDSCAGLDSIAELSQLKRLEALSLSRCKSVSDFTPISKLSQLKRLDLNFCDGLTNLDWVSELKNLEQLNLESCQNLTDWSALKTLGKLKGLDLSACPNISRKDIEELKKLLPDTEVRCFFG